MLLVLQTCLVGHLQAHQACPKEKVACCGQHCVVMEVCASVLQRIFDKTELSVAQGV